MILNIHFGPSTIVSNSNQKDKRFVDVVCQKRYAAEKLVWIPTDGCCVDTWPRRMNL